MALHREHQSAGGDAESQSCAVDEPKLPEEEEDQEAEPWQEAEVQEAEKRGRIRHSSFRQQTRQAAQQRQR